MVNCSKRSFSAELCGVASVGPAHIVGKNVAVLPFDGGQIFRSANGRSSVTEADRRQAADFFARLVRNSGKRNSQLLRDVLVVVQAIAMRVEVIEAEAKFIDQIVVKSMDFAGCKALGCVVAIAILKAATVKHIVEWRGKKITVVAITVADKEIILFANCVVDANIELVFGLAAFRICQVIAAGQSAIRSGK